MSLRNRIFLVFVFTAALAVWGLVNWMSSDMRPRYMEAQEDLMVDLGHILAAQIASSALQGPARDRRPDPQRLQAAFGQIPAQSISAQIYRLHKTRVDVRIYVTDAAGVVLFDTDAGRDLGRDNSQWRDIKLSLVGDYGARSTEGDPMYPEGATMYVSTPIRDGDEIVGVVSVGKPTRNAERFRASAISRFSQAAALASLLALIVALVLYWWLSRPLLQLHDYARDLRLGKRVPPPALGHNEIGRVGAAMTELRDALDGKQYVEAYVQSLTHELKSPTAAIAGAAELLGEDLPEEDRERFLTNIGKETARLQILIERMLQLAGIESRAALEAEATETIDVAELVHESLESLEALLRQKDLRTETLIDSGVCVHGERFLLMQAVTNLLANAMEFSPPGGLIRVLAHSDGVSVRILIIDQGPGIPDYARDRVFDRFYCLAHPDGSKGTGLGLSFVAQIAELHGGSVRVENALEGGAAAQLCVPVAH